MFDPHSTSCGSTVDYREGWSNDVPPDILERYRRLIVPSQDCPSDRVSCSTYRLEVAFAPVPAPVVQIVNRQPEGIASKVTIAVRSITDGIPFLLSGPERGAEVSVGAGVRSVISNGFALFPLKAGTVVDLPYTYVLHTRAPLWLTVVPDFPGTSASGTVTVLQEHYDI